MVFKVLLLDILDKEYDKLNKIYLLIDKKKPKLTTKI